MGKAECRTFYFEEESTALPCSFYQGNQEIYETVMVCMSVYAYLCASPFLSPVEPTDRHESWCDRYSFGGEPSFVRHVEDGKLLK
jgi:hypothetical protein